MTRKQIRESIVELPYRAMEAEALRRMGSLEDLELDAACKKQLFESLDRFLKQENSLDGRES